MDGVKLAGVLIDAGTVNSDTLLEVGPAGSSADHSANPTTVQDVFVRIGGAGPGKAADSWSSTATTRSSTTSGCGAPTTATASAGPSTPPTTA